MSTNGVNGGTGGPTAPDPAMMGLAPDGETVVVDPGAVPDKDGNMAVPAPPPTGTPDPTTPPEGEGQTLTDALAEFMAGEGEHVSPGEAGAGVGEDAAPTPPPAAPPTGISQPAPQLPPTRPDGLPDFVPEGTETPWLAPSDVPPVGQPLPQQQYQQPAPQPGTFDAMAHQYYGRTPSPAEAQALFDVANRLRTLPPEQQAQVEAMLYPGVAGVPQTPPQPQPQPQPYPPYTQPTIGQSDPYAEPDAITPVVQAAMAPVQEQLATVTQYMQQQAEQQVAAQRAQVAQQIDAGVTAFNGRYSLTPQESEALQQRVAQQGIMTALYQSTGSGQAAIEQAMEQTYWGDPAWRQREALRLAGQQNAATTQQQADEAKAHKAGALAPGGAIVPRTDPEPQTKDQRQAALVQGVTEAMSQG